MSEIIAIMNQKGGVVFPTPPFWFIMAIMNQKGGVGKTTTCLNLGSALTELSFNVLLIDLDPAGSLTSWANGDNHDDNPDIGSMLKGDASFDDTIRTSANLKLDFLGSGTMLRKVSENGNLDINGLKNNLEPIRDKYHFILIDCPPSLNILAENALIASNSIIIPIQTETLPLRGGVKFLEWLDGFRNLTDKQIKILGILPCMYDSRTKLSEKILETMRASENLGPFVFKTVIRKNVRLAEMPWKGRSIFKSASGSYGATDYLDLAREVVNRAGEILLQDNPPLNDNIEVLNENVYAGENTEHPAIGE
jgi:chromosome partitioning protein